MFYWGKNRQKLPVIHHTSFQNSSIIHLVHRLVGVSMFPRTKLPNLIVNKYGLVVSIL
jgi:hypothetical protein